MSRCPSCGRLILTPQQRCPSCGDSLDSTQVVGEDTSPYANPLTRNYFKMVWWVLSAGSYRLAHLGRMRRSGASLRFSLINLMLLGVCAGIALLPTHAWRVFRDNGLKYPLGYPEPEGQGWNLLAEAKPPDGSVVREEVIVRLWWNPKLTSITLAINVIAFFLLGLTVLSITIGLGDSALHPASRDEERFTAAIHYSTAHVPLLLLAALCYGSIMLSALASAQQWNMQWSAAYHLVPAALLGGLGLFLWWFWFLRLANTAPPGSTGRASRYFGGWSTLLFVGVFTTWLVGQYYGIPLLADELGMAY